MQHKVVAEGSMGDLLTRAMGEYHCTTFEELAKVIIKQQGGEDTPEKQKKMTQAIEELFSSEFEVHAVAAEELTKDLEEKIKAAIVRHPAAVDFTLVLSTLAQLAISTAYMCYRGDMERVREVFAMLLDIFEKSSQD